MYFLTLWNARGCQDTRSELSSGHMFCQGACLFVTYAYKAFFHISKSCLLRFIFPLSYIFSQLLCKIRKFITQLRGMLTESPVSINICYYHYLYNIQLSYLCQTYEIYTLSFLLFLIVVINVHCCFFYILTFKFTCLTSLFDRLMAINKMSVHSPDSVAGV